MSATAPACPDATQPQCQFFVLRKKRLCRMTVRPGRQYCGEHEPQPPADLHEADKRIPCPNDPKHTCYASKLEKHLAKCNARQTEDPPYIVRNLNAPEDENPSPRIPLKDVPAHTLRQVIDKINQLYDKHVSGTISMWQAPEHHHPSVEASLSEAGRADTSRRHLRQASRLMQLAEESGLVEDGTCYVELGAGKGMLSYYVGVSWCGPGSGSSVVCVDRAALRHKRDNLLPAGAACRLRADLRHLALHRAEPVERATAVIGLAKHLCGVATDYALRCVCAEGVASKTRGVLLATCCHHRCEAPAYVGTDKLQELGISREELNIMFGIVSWATCGDGRSRDHRGNDPEHRNHHTNETNTEHDNTTHQTLHNNHNNKPDDIQNNDEKQAHDNADAITDIEVKTKKQKLSQEESKTDSTTLHPDVESRPEDTTSSIDHQQQTSSHHTENSTNNVTDTNIETSSETKEEENNTFIPLDIKSREEVGRRAKALVDHGRVLFLRDRGFEASLCYYVPTTESLENVCLLARKPRASCTGRTFI